jgi:hypothetical protein
MKEIVLSIFLSSIIIFVVKNISKVKLNYPPDPQYENKELKTLG